MKTIGSIIGALAFLIGAGFILVAALSIGDETTISIARGVVGTALLVFAIGIALSQQATELKDHVAYQNKLLVDIAESSRLTASALAKLGQRRKK